MIGDIDPVAREKANKWRLLLLSKLTKAFKMACRKRFDDASNVLDELTGKAAEWQHDLVEDAERDLEGI